MVPIINIVPAKKSAMITLKETADDTFSMDTICNIKFAFKIIGFGLGV